MKPIQALTPEEARGIRFVLTDIDDTLTKAGKLLAPAYTALWNLHEAGVGVIPVTGRPAGWCDLIAREWPVDGVIGENGAFAFWEERGILQTAYHPGAVRNDHPVLARIRERACGEFPELRLAKDQFARLFDMALDFAEEEPVLPLETARRVRDIAVQEGALAKVSSIHINIWIGRYDKVAMAERFLTSRFGWTPGRGDSEVLFVGDSPNDEPMFARFPFTCGVANISRYSTLIQRLPAFIASKECGYGFAEIADLFLARRTP